MSSMAQLTKPEDRRWVRILQCEGAISSGQNDQVRTYRLAQKLALCSDEVRDLILDFNVVENVSNLVCVESFYSQNFLIWNGK